MTAVGFEPTQLALVELESTPLDHSGKVSLGTESARKPTHNVQHGAVAGLVPLPICGAGAARLRHVPKKIHITTAGIRHRRQTLMTVVP